MRDGRKKLAFLFALGIVALTSRAVAAADNLSIDDILGTWCGTVTNYAFSRTELNVTPLKGQTLTHGTVLTIAKVVGRPTQIDVYWLPPRPDNYTKFELSSDRKSLIQVRETVGDKGPERRFHRC